MKTKAIAAVSFCLMMVLLSVGIPTVAAKPATKYSVVLSVAPHERYRSYTLVAGSNASGEWVGGGSGVLVGGFSNPNEVQVILDLKVVDGGFGTFTNPYVPGVTDNFFLEASVTKPVVHNPELVFPPSFLGLIKGARLTFDFTEGRSVQPVTLWLFLDPYPWPPYIPDWWCYPPPGYPRTLMTAITQIG